MISEGWATQWAFRVESSPLGDTVGRVFSDLNRISFSLDVKHVATVSAVSPSRRMAHRRRFYPSYELGIEFEFHQTTSTLALIGLLFDQTSRHTVGGFDVRVFEGVLDDEIPTCTFWLKGPDFGGKVMRIRGAAVSSVTISTPRTRSVARLSIKLVALALDYVSIFPATGEVEPAGADPVTTLHSGAYFTETSFGDDPTPFELPNVTNLSVKLYREIEAARYNAQGYPQRLRCSSRSNAEASITLSADGNGIEDWTRWNRSGSGIIRFGNSDLYRIEILFPSCQLTTDRMALQSTEAEIARSLNMYAVQDMGQSATAVLRTIRGWNDAMYFTLNFYGDLIQNQAFGKYEAPFELQLVGVEWALQNACVGSEGRMQLYNAAGEEIGDAVRFIESEKSGRAVFETPIILAAGDAVTAKIVEIGSGESGAGLTANLILAA